MIVFIVFGPVNYPVAVIIRALHFLTIFMHEATVITILIMRQIIILKVFMKVMNFIRGVFFVFDSQFGFATWIMRKALDG